MPVVNVSQAVSLPNNGTEDIYLINIGSVRAWYSQEANVATGNGLPLDPGNAITWSAGKDLYACADNTVAGAVAILALENNGSNITIGATSAVIDGPVEVSGSVNSTAVGTTAIQGAVNLQNVPVGIASITTNVQALAAQSYDLTHALAAFQNVDISQYTAIRVEVSTAWGGNVNADIANYINLTIVQGGVGGPVPNTAYNGCQWLLMNAKEYSYTVPVRKSTATIIANLTVTNAPLSAVNVTLKLYGISTPNPVTEYVHYCDTIPTGGNGMDPGLVLYGGIDDIIATISSTTKIVPSRSGEAHVNLIKIAGNTSVSDIVLQALSYGAASTIARANIPASATPFAQINLALPALPIQAVFSVQTVTGTSAYSLTKDLN